MSTNYSLKVARNAIQSNNKEMILECGKRFPLTSNILTRIGSNEALDELFNALPEHITMKKIESVLKEGVVITTKDDEVESEAEVPETEAGEDDGDSEGTPKKMSKEEKARKRKEARAAKRKAAKEGSKDETKEEEPMNKPEEPAEDAKEDSDEEDYSKMSAVELFKLCKKKGIKAEPKQKAEVYIKLLNSQDEESSDDEDEDDDWDI